MDEKIRWLVRVNMAGYMPDNIMECGNLETAFACAIEEKRYYQEECGYVVTGNIRKDRQYWVDDPEREHFIPIVITIVENEEM